MNDLYLSEINIYPVKSLGGISLSQSQMQEKGLQYDRKWMLIDDEGTFISQRKHHELALLQVNINGDLLTISHKHHPENNISFRIGSNTGQFIPVSIWDDQCIGLEVSLLVNQWFSDFMNMKVGLVEMPDDEKRLVDQKYAGQEDFVNFADGYPCLVIGQASLNYLNEKLTEPVDMNRFRPNFVFTGGIPHLEDDFHTFHIGDILFTAVKPCARCVLTTIDQQTGAKGSEPLRTLSGYRTKNNKVLFGQNLVHSGCGLIRVGDQISVQEWK